MLQHTPNLAERPYITVTNTTAAQIMGEAITILLKSQEAAPRLFTQRGGVWVRLRDAGAGELEVLTRDALKLEMDRAIEFRIPSERGNSYTVAPPPRDLVNGILSADRYPDVPELPELRRVATAPYFTADGELVLQPGYHAGSRTFLRLPASLQGLTPPAAQPSHADVEKAKHLLVEDVFVDFPFVAPSSSAHILALLITPFVRELIGPGPVPMAAIVAPTVGSGKTKLAHVVSLIVTGEQAPVMAAEVQREEVEKRITSLLLAAAPYGVFDNAVEKVDSPALAALLTSDIWSGRILGKSQMVKLANATQWIITGNNLSFTDEMARRALTIALDPKTDAPNLRTGFKHDPLERWVKQERPALVRAILTLVRHWLAQGQPAFTARTLGSFESYVHVVGGILQASALDEGFLTPTTAEPSSPFTTDAPPKDADADLHRLVVAWERTFGYAIVDAGKLFEVAPPDLTAEVKSPRIALGKFVQRSVGRTIAGHRIVSAQIKDADSRLRNGWRLVNAEREAREA